MSETRTVSPTLEERLRGALEDASRATVMETRVSTGTARQPDTDTEIPYSRQRFSFLDDSFIQAFLAAAKEHGLVIGEGERLEELLTRTEEVVVDQHMSRLSLRRYEQGWEDRGDAIRLAAATDRLQDVDWSQFPTLDEASGTPADD